MTTVLIVIAGSIGCVARWLIEEIAQRRGASHRPFATMAVNILGAIVTGFVIYLAAHAQWSAPQRHPFSVNTEPVILTGFCGGFTTFSSALAIPYLDWREGNRLRAGVLIGATPILCILGLLFGEALANL